MMTQCMQLYLCPQCVGQRRSHGQPDVSGMMSLDKCIIRQESRRLFSPKKEGDYWAQSTSSLSSRLNLSLDDLIWDTGSISWDCKEDSPS